MTAGYVLGVVAVLAEELPGLQDSGTRSIVAGLIEKLMTGAVHEVIADDPSQANWRLYPARGGVRLSCTRIRQRPGDREREERVNRRILALGAPA
jgi:hypothetical protein